MGMHIEMGIGVCTWVLNMCTYTNTHIYMCTYTNTHFNVHFTLKYEYIFNTHFKKHYTYKYTRQYTHTHTHTNTHTHTSHTHTHTYICHDSVAYVPRLIHICAMTQSHMCHASSHMCFTEKRQRDVAYVTHLCLSVHTVPWLIHICAMTQSHMCHILAMSHICAS